MKSTCCWNRFVILLLAAMLLYSKGRALGDTGTREDREAVFDYLVEKTLHREAFSPIKEKKLGLDFGKHAAALKDEFALADTDDKLYRAILKLSNLRRDQHLWVDGVDGGIKFTWSVQEAPLRFAPDYAATTPIFFVAKRATNFSQYSRIIPAIGDTLVSVNGIDVREYLALMDPYLRYSTRATCYWEFARNVSTKQSTFGPELMQADTVAFELENRDGERYTVKLPYLDTQTHRWTTVADKAPSAFGFRQVMKLTCFTLYRSSSDVPVVLLVLHGFDARTIVDDVKKLMEYCQENQLLDHDIIVDSTHASGGARGADLVRVLTPKTFKTTMCDVRISDVTPQLAKKLRADFGSQAPIVEWFENDVQQAAVQNKPYSSVIPLRLEHLPKESDGTMKPADVHFRGNFVCLMTLPTGSHVDQFAAMVVDNELGHTIGMPTGGFSNSWEWDEVIVFPSTKKPVMRFMWSVGHTLRPNGEVLEGNPPDPKEFVPLTRDNYTTYYDGLLKRALDHLSTIRQPKSADRSK